MLPVALTTPPVLTLPPVALPDTDTEVKVPTLVMLGCAAVVTVPAVPAVTAEVALATVPVMLAAVIVVSKLPSPIT